MQTTRLTPSLSTMLTVLTLTWPWSTGLAADVTAWHWQDPEATMGINLRQRQPDAVRAFFQARGFSPADADAIARQCIFLIGVSNTINESATGALDIDLSTWRVDRGNDPQPLHLKERWLEHWAQSDTPETARTAFYWSMYHTRQHLEPGERMFGMISMGLPAGTRFRLDFSWRRGDTKGQSSLFDLQCAPDPSNESPKE